MVMSFSSQVAQFDIVSVFVGFHSDSVFRC